jgi:subtilisin family serine protease
LAVTPSLTVSIDESYSPAYISRIMQEYNLRIVRRLAFTDTEYEVKIEEPITDIGRLFELCRIVADMKSVKWAEPDFIATAETQFFPDDTLFNNQWHLNNTGQSGAAVDADIDAPEGWDFSLGFGTVIAIYDNGVETTHEDLAIFSNPGETGDGKETNGIDDDGNGFIDDYQGWDFSDNDNNPNPSLSTDNHGTAVAGVAGAIGNNAVGVSGSAQGGLILPVRMKSGSCTGFADAMRYAGKYGHVVNNSWTITACESALNSAISDVVNGNITGARRGTLGTPVLFASGNSASGWRKFTLSGFAAGTYIFEWRFSKDVSVSDGYDTVWLDDVTWPGGASDDFEEETAGTVPNGFTSTGDANWAVVNEGTHARGASGNSVKAGTITDRQSTSLNSTREVGAGALTFWVWVSSEQYYDFFELYVDRRLYFRYAPGQNGHNNNVGYPASNPDTIAVGASNDGSVSGIEERSFYSQFGSDLDVVAPSSSDGQGITTTDRMGANGYTTSNYTSTFGGTSSATPLVAGVAANLIADDPTLDAGEIRALLRDGTDKIGPYVYSGGRNDFYGYGRVNLLNSVYLCALPVKIDRAVPAYYSSLQAAYNATADGETILSQAVILTEELSINLSKTIVLEGGYDCAFATVTGKTTMNGNMTVTNGTLTIGNFEVQQ